jgi:O-antigen/teichoic acid export membrane protein
MGVIQRNPSVQRNLIANFAGRIWGAGMMLAFIPIYIRFLGVEAYGLVGFLATLQVIFSLLDLGMSTTLNREMAYHSTQDGNENRTRNLLRTLEIISWFMAAVLALLIFLLSPFIAHHWLHPARLSETTVNQALQMMGLTIALQFPFIFYTGGLLGLQKHVSFNVLTIITSTLRGVGTALILWLISPTIQAYLICQMSVNALQTIFSAWILWRNVPKSSEKPGFRPALLKQIGGFAGSLTLINVVSLLLTQMDKVVLSKLLPLESFGYYSVATVISSGLLMMVHPVYTAVFPRFSQLVSLGNEESLKKVFHFSCQILSVLILPLTFFICFFSRDVLLLWTKDPQVSNHAYLLVSVLVAATALDGLQWIPFALQLAYGWTKLPLLQKAICLILLFPLLILGTMRYGAIGACVAILIVNVSSLIIGSQIMYSRLLKSEKWNWYIHDLGRPLLGALLTTMLLSFLLKRLSISHSSLPLLGGILLLSIAAATLFTPSLRVRLQEQFHK